MKSVVPIRDRELLDDLTVTFTRNMLLPWSQIKFKDRLNFGNDHYYSLNSPTFCYSIKT